ncbi:DUF3329 domain-containing protein [Aureimonas populi]|uniref:DUF3329 domain-containing protein n=1 Tax=Aureimonas populi TaxID=1701758 RepID=A0ABW5CN22_9HYPH|nr:DUF3329 domain-containing protein [Aureimonas populi]
MRNDSSHPFFRPLWRRVLVVAFCLAWSAIEWYNDQTFWGVLTLLIAAYGVWALFLNFDAGPASGEER